MESNHCRCPLCRRFPRTMKKISEMEAKPLSPESQKILKGIVDAAYAKLAERIHRSHSAPEQP